MVTLPRSSRGKSGGKLTDVLDFQLRVGDAQVAESIIAAYKERGLTPPDHVESPPAIAPEFLVYWEAYRDLISERRSPRGPIPALSVIAYADAYSLDREALKRIVYKVDRVLTDHWRAQDDAAEIKRKADHNRKQSGSQK
jgi:hypothetical protein